MPPPAGLVYSRKVKVVKKGGVLLFHQVRKPALALLFFEKVRC
jgi:hypothetical protein